MITESAISKKLNEIPAVGSRIKVTYICEYEGVSMQYEKKPKKTNRLRTLWTRQAVVVQKVHNGMRSHLTVEIQPEAGEDRSGRYRVSFMMRDVVMGLVKVQEVE